MTDIADSAKISQGLNKDRDQVRREAEKLFDLKVTAQQFKKVLECDL